jgi:hypothetical protein
MQASMRALLDLAILILLAACTKKTESTPDAAPPVASTTPMPYVPEPLAPRAAEAERLQISDLRKMPELPPDLASHFGDAKTLDVQVARRGHGKGRAVLVTSGAAAVVLVLGEDNRELWRKDHPVAGITPPASPLAIAAGPQRRIALAACVPATKAVALRLWDSDGSPFADYQVLEMEGCEAVSLLHWPRRGFIVVAAAEGVTRARYVTEEGALDWAADVGVRSRPAAIAPAALAADTDETFVLVQPAQMVVGVKDAPFHALAFRYDLRGQPVWQQAVALGGARRGVHLEVEPIAPAGVHVAIPERVRIAADVDVDVKPSGAFSPRSPARK